MKIISDIPQGSEAWLAHRRTCRNASEAPAVMGASPYVSRAQLIRQRYTGIEPEIDAATQARFDHGHAVEPALRAFGERLIGQDFYPVTGVSDSGYLGASFDGVTMDETIIAEVKQRNAQKMEMVKRGEIPPADYWQIVQQFAVCESALQCLYIVGDGTDDGTVWLGIKRGDLEADIIHLWRAWEQFDADVAAYQPEVTAAPAATGHAPDQLPALRIELTGMVTESNLADWKEAAIAVFQGINSDLQTDQDFADAERTVRWCGDIEDQLKAAKQHALSQTTSIDELFRTVDAISEEARQTRLKLDKLVKARKETIRTEIVEGGRRAVLAHFDAINASMGAHALLAPAGLLAELGASIKGRKTVASLNDAVDGAVANFKIAASQRAEAVRANIHALEMEIGSYGALFPDQVQLCATKQPEDLRNLITARAADHKVAEAKRLDAERERIRLEEVARLESEQAAAALKAAEDAKPAPEPAPVAETSFPPLEAVPAPARSTPTAVPASRIKLGQINERIAPMTISAEGLATLGFKPVGTERAAKLYSEAEFPNIVRAMGRVLRDALDLDKAA